MGAINSKVNPVPASPDKRFWSSCRSNKLLRGLSAGAESNVVEYSGHSPTSEPFLQLSNQTPSKILLVRFSALGDVVQTIPILSMLRDAFPHAKIGWAIDAELVSTVQGHPALDYVHACHRRQWAKSFKNPTRWPQAFGGMSEFVDEIRSVNYDVAVDAQGLFKTALVPFLAGIKRRIGYGHGREFSSLFYNEKYLSFEEYFDPAVFHLDHMALLCKAIGCSEVRHLVEAPPVSAEMTAQMAATLKQGFSNTNPIIAMAPGTQWVSKAWPEEYWVALLDRVLEKTSFNVVMLGSKGDASLVSKILNAFPGSATNGRVLDISGQTSVQQMYSLFSQVEAHVGSDSAPLHIAGAVRTPHLIGIYGPTAYRRTPPIGSPDIQLFSTEGNLSCQPCHKKTCPLGTTECMTLIKPDDVFNALVEALNGNKEPALTGAYQHAPTHLRGQR